MTCTFDHPVLRHTLAAVVRLVDAFTGMPLRDRYELRLTGSEWWAPVFRNEDATYRFLVSGETVPALGAVVVTITPTAAAPAHRDVDGLTLTIPPAGAPPVPLTTSHFLVDHRLWPTRAFRPPPSETFIRGRVRRAGQPLPGHRVRIAAGAAPGPATPAAPTDDDGEFAYRLPGLKVVAPNPAGVVATAGLQVGVTDGGGVAQALAAPAVPIPVPIGRTTTLTLDLA